jgi:hypothetical protein
MTDVSIREIADLREVMDEPGPPRIPSVSTREEAEAKLAEARALLARLRARREA